MARVDFNGYLFHLGRVVSAKELKIGQLIPIFLWTLGFGLRVFTQTKCR